MTAARKRGSSLDEISPRQEEAEEAPRVLKTTSKQTVEIGRRTLGRIREQCAIRGLSFQQWAMAAFDRELQAAGEPASNEIEEGK